MSRRNPILQTLGDPTKNFLSFFLIGVLLFTLFSNGISDLFWKRLGAWLQQQLGIPNETVLQIWMSVALLVVILLVIYSTNLAAWLRRSLAKLGIAAAIVPDTAKVVPLTETCLGLVAIMSPKDNAPAEIAIRHHWNQGVTPRLTHCWLICTAESVEYARRLQQRLIEEGLGERLILYYGDFEIPDPEHPGRSLRLMVDAESMHDPDAMLHLVNAIYAHAASLGLSEAEMIVDITGGIKPMGVGAFLACARPERRLAYITSVGDVPQLMEIRVAYQLKPIR